MYVHRFKPGDKVLKRDSQVLMTVQRYAKLYNNFVGWYHDRNFLVCSWYDSSNGYQEEVFHQKNLIKPTKKQIIAAKKFIRPEN